MSSIVAQAGAIFEIVWINILLSADNAILVALACRNLPENQQRIGVALGASGAIALRIAFTIIVAQLLDVPFLTLAGGLFVIFLAVQLPRQGPSHPDVPANRTLVKAVLSIIVADVLVSLDNALALAAAAQGSVRLIVFGLLISGPTVMIGARFLASVMSRFPVLIWIGAVILGWAGGQLIARDPAVRLLGMSAPLSATWLGAAGSSVVLITAALAKLRNKQRERSGRRP
jgi:YjbE family integral membrane protein